MLVLAKKNRTHEDTCPRARTKIQQNVLPRHVASRLKSGDRIADGHQTTSVIFCDIPSFGELAHTMSPTKAVALLDEIFVMMDEASLEVGRQQRLQPDPNGQG